MTKFEDNISPYLSFVEGAAPSSPAATNFKLYYDSADHLLKWKNSAGTVTTIATGSGTAGTSILLTYDLAADVTNQAITAGNNPFDVFANQNFTVASASSIVEVAVRGMGFFNDAVTNEYMARINIDSAGTPVIRYFGAANNTNTTTNSRNNPFAGGSVFLSGLTAAVHTIKVQVLASSVNDHFYCRASTNGPTTGGEFLTVQVIEHKN